MPSVASRRRAWLLLAATGTTAYLLWHVRPAAPGGVPTPDRDIVAGCAWLAWCLVGYLTLAVAAASLHHLSARAGAPRAWLVRLTPHQLRRLVELGLTVSLTAGALGGGVLGGGAVASAAPSRSASHAQGSAPSAGGSALDWPGLAAVPTRPIATSPTATPAPQRTATPGPGHPARRHPDPGLVSGGHVVRSLPGQHAGQVVVRRGDTLWSIASQALGPRATATAITAAWHRWYAANRDVIGGDPGLILPGQQLHAPSAAPVHHSRPGSTS